MLLAPQKWARPPWGMFHPSWAQLARSPVRPSARHAITRPSPAIGVMAKRITGGRDMCPLSFDTFFRAFSGTLSRPADGQIAQATGGELLSASQHRKSLEESIQVPPIALRGAPGAFLPRESVLKPVFPLLRKFLRRSQVRTKVGHELGAHPRFGDSDDF